MYGVVVDGFRVPTVNAGEFPSKTGVVMKKRKRSEEATKNGFRFDLCKNCVYFHFG